MGDEQMKPVIIVPPETMSAEDIKMLRDNGLCVVVSKEPSAVKFLDPIPSISSRTDIEQAAIQLSRRVMSPNFWNDTGHTRKEIIAAYFDILTKGTPLDHRQSTQEREREIFDSAKADELRRLAREEAKAEREAAKKVKSKT